MNTHPDMTQMMSTKTAASNAPNFAKNSSAIKPSVSFMNLSREQMKIKHYVDLQDGPSSLQKRDGIPTIQEKSKTPLLYESERKDHMDRTESNRMNLTSIRDVLF